MAKSGDEMKSDIQLKHDVIGELRWESSVISTDTTVAVDGQGQRELTT
jgi:hypothetical protein